MENTAKSRFFQLFSLRFVLIAALNVGTTCLVYYGSRIVNLSRVYHCISVPADDLIPFVPGFILVYVLAFVQWGLNYLQLAHVDKTTCLRFAGALLLFSAAAARLSCRCLPTQREQERLPLQQLLRELTESWRS